MSLPYVKVNVNEENYTQVNTEIPFVPVVIMKTKSGPIGTREVVRSEKEFVNKFGNADYTVPSAYGIQTYLRSYSYVLVTRVAGTSAANGKGTIKSSDIDILSAETKYKTDIFNGKELALVYDSANKKLYITLETANGIITSVKETIDLSVADTKAPVLEAALEKIVKSFNNTDCGVVLTNLYTTKTESDEKPEFTTLSVKLGEGDSGNSDSITDTVIKGYIDAYCTPEYEIDVMIVPEFNTAEIVNYGAGKADLHDFLYISSRPETTKDEILEALDSYNQSASLAVYAPDVYYNNLKDANGNDVAIPAAVAVLHGYAKNDIANKWGAPAGVTRATLSLAKSQVISLTKDDLDSLYDANIPVNAINNISGQGLVIWGQKTTDSITPFMDRINVSRLCKYVKRKTYAMSYRYLFEPITEALFTKWETAVRELLDTLVTSNAISEYKVRMDSTLNTAETIAQNKLIGQVRIKPLEVAEFIDIDLIITDQVEV